MKNTLYEKLFKLSHSTQLLSSIQKLVDWDQETVMPKEGISLRIQQLELLAHMVHKEKTSKKFARALDALIDIETGEIKDDRVTPPQVAALREWRREYIKTIKLPASFVKKCVKTTSTACHVWRTAKEHSDFRSFAPHLERIVSLCRQQSDILGFREHPYDPLLDLYEPEMKTLPMTAILEHLKGSLSILLKAIQNQPLIRDTFLHHFCSKHKQLDFSHKLLNKMGLSEDLSRLDLSAHPFCTTLHPLDTRMTTCIRPDDPLFCIFAVLHEGGHALYNKGLPKEHYGSPLCEQISLGIDESQSRWWETLIGQSYPFWQYFFPLLQQEIPDAFASISLEDFYRAINAVKPGLIRIEADEVTYNLHIIVRFEIEKGLIEGSLKVKDLPEIWNEKMRDNLGISPIHDSEGCLQDIHWSLGIFGYFPTYTLGNLYASQFFESFEKAHPSWKEEVAQGHLDFIREWLRVNIHQYGKQFSAMQLCKKVSGLDMSEEPFMNYLHQKYQALYHLKA